MISNIPYTAKSLFSQLKRGIKVPVEEEPNQPPLTLLCVSDHLLSFVIVVDERAAMKVLCRS